MTREREGGFIVLHRRVKSWPLWQFMSAEQRMVWLEILILANWKDSEAWHGTERITVRRGELIHSENTIARGAKVSRKVVRTAIEKLLAEGAVVRRRALAQAHGPHIITVVNYSKYQDVPDEEGPLEGQERAKDGPSTGPARALSEQVEQEEQEKHGAAPLALFPQKPATPTAARPTPANGAANGTGQSGAPVAAPKPKEKRDPLRRALSDALVAVYAVERLSGYGFDKGADPKALDRLLSFSRDINDHVRRFRLALREPAGDYSYRVDTLAQFATGRIWNHFPPAQQASVQGVPRLN